LAFNSSTSFEVAVAEWLVIACPVLECPTVEWPVGRVGGLEALEDPVIDERRFLASATAPDPEVLGLCSGADLLVVVAALPVALEVELVAEGLVAVFGLVAVPDEIVGFRGAVEEEVVPRFSARVSDLAGEPCAPEGARDVLREAEVKGFFFSSPDPVWAL
jgi:hypothetical protein